MPEFFNQLKEKYKDSLIKAHSHLGEDTLVLPRKTFKEAVRFLKDDDSWKMNILMDLTAVDYLDEKKENRFEVVYHLYSMQFQRRIRIRVPVSGKDPQIDTLCDLWPVANWLEREVWDMFGIRFKGHPDLRRLLMYEEFEGHPLRKDYPLNKTQSLIESKVS